MKILTSNLMPPALDWAVCVCEKTQMGAYTRYSTEWAHGGPIIEREGICLSFNPEDDAPEWSAEDRSHAIFVQGPTPLIAAMRCYVASKLDEKIEIPKELQP